MNQILNNYKGTLVGWVTMPAFIGAMTLMIAAMPGCTGEPMEALDPPDQSQELPGNGGSVDGPSPDVPAPNDSDSPAADPDDPGGGGGDEPLEPNPSAPPAGPAIFRVDAAVQPSTPSVAGLEDGDEPRPVGCFEDSAGLRSELVLFELVVAVYDDTDLDAMLERLGGEVADGRHGDDLLLGGDGDDLLVRIDPARIDTRYLSADLARTDPELRGDFRASSPDVIKTLAAAARETTVYGNEVSLNWVGGTDSIADGTSMEAGNLGQPDAFQWSFIRSGAVQDIGLDAAWQMLEARGKFANKVRVMIADGGFSSNPDFPEEVTLRQTEWGAPNLLDCGGNPCPWHGTQVVLTAMGRMDNDYGTAGPAAPVAELIACGIWQDVWKTYRRIEMVVDEEDPHVVNMSFSYKISVFKDAAEKAANRRFKRMKDNGALLFASAGNDGINVDNTTCVGNNCSESLLIIPCESPHVVCVGGMGANTTYKHAGSNYGTKPDARSVEIYGPFQTIGLVDPGNAYSNTDAKSITGTSFSSPFVAGVAALVKAADPSLSPDEILEILKSTAHDGGVGLPVVFDEGSQLRINAMGAVMAALGLEYEEPGVVIESPDHNKDYALDHWFTLKGHATDFYGYERPMMWHSSLDGDLTGAPQIGDVHLQTLSEGTHVITATAVDLRGGEGSAQVTIHVVNEAPDVVIVVPLNGEEFYENTPIDLAAFTQDPDTYGPLPDGDVRWEVRRSGSNQVVYTGSGHQRTVPALSPGNYVVVLEGLDGSASGEDSVMIEVIDIPAGQTPPMAFIDLPSADIEIDAYNGHPETIELSGRGVDAEDGNLSGTNMRWTAVSENGTKVVICTGSAFGVNNGGGGGGGGGIGGFTGGGGGGGGGIGDLINLKNCKSPEAHLGLDPGSIGYTQWTITLEVEDSTGLIGKAKVNVRVRFITG